MAKSGKITLCMFNNPYNPPSGGVLYVHTLNLDNGDVGKTYAKTQYPPELANGQTINYTINEKSIIKLEAIPNPTANAHSADRKPSPNKQLDAIGYSFSYAKDILVAKIQSEAPAKAPAKGAAAKPAGNQKSLADQLIEIAVPIYNKMVELRDQEQAKTAQNQ